MEQNIGPRYESTWLCSLNIQQSFQNHMMNTKQPLQQM
jgi:hypothetical protein